MSSYPIEVEEYKAYKNQISLINDVFDGSTKAQNHLEQFEMEDAKKFNFRKKVATLNNYVKRTIENRKNIVFRKPLNLENIKNNELFEWCKSNINLRGESLNEFAKLWLENADKEGYCFALVDAPKIDRDVVRTRVDEAKQNIRPYATLIKRKDLFYFEKDEFGNYKTIAFWESYKVKKDKFLIETAYQAKVIYDDGMVEIYRDNKLYQEYQREVKALTLVRLGKSDTPIFYDMAKTNINLFNRESEKSNYVRIGAAPFPILYGSLMGNDKGVKTISINDGLHFTSKSDAGFEWAEMSGRNYDIILKEIEHLGSTMMEDSINFSTESNVKTATQVEKDSTVDESKLTDRATQLERAINQMLYYFSLFNERLGDDNTVVVNKDFATNRLSSDQVAQLISMYTQGILSWERLNTMLQNGEILDYLDEKQLAEEKLKIDNEAMGI